MIKKIGFPLLAIVTPFFAFADVELNGVYQGKNIYVQNPFTSNMKDYCTQEVFVNDVRMMASVTASAYEIDLSYLSFNDPVNIRITHKTDCNPKILNPQVVKINSSFTFNAVNISDRKLSWSVKNQKSSGRYFIERFEFNHWRIVGETYSRDFSTYELDLNHNSGINKYRLKYMEDGKIIYSEVIDFDAGLEPLTFYPKRVTDFITLSREANYEILDRFGNIISKGTKREIDLSTLPSDVYYLNADNRTFKIFKK